LNDAHDHQEFAMQARIFFAAFILAVLGSTEFATAQRTQVAGRDSTSLQDGRRDARGRHQRRRSRRKMRRERVRRTLGVTEEQRQLGREAAKELAPLRDELRPRVRELGEHARERLRSGDREGARTLLKNELRPLIEDARRRARPHVQSLLESITPEQRERLEAAATRRGQHFDEERLAGHLGRRLLLRQRER
jgi:hypothetical protein